MARSSRDYHDLATEYGIKSPGMQPGAQSQQWRDRVDNVHSQAQRTGSVDSNMVNDASRMIGKPGAYRSPGATLAHTPPPPSKPSRPDWANDPNVGKD